MEPEDIGSVLAVAAAFDNRTVGTADSMAWYRVIGHLDQREAEEAIIAHYTETNDRVMPNHVLERVGKIRALRIAHAGPEAVPDADPDDVAAYQQALREGRHRTAAGMTSRPVRQAIEHAFHHVPSHWSRNAITVPAPRALAAGSKPAPPDDPDHAAALEVLGEITDAQRWIVRARAELEAEGARLDKAAVAIRAAELATRPADDQTGPS